MGKCKWIIEMTYCNEFQYYEMFKEGYQPLGEPCHFKDDGEYTLIMMVEYCMKENCKEHN